MTSHGIDSFSCSPFILRVVLVSHEFFHRLNYDVNIDLPIYMEFALSKYNVTLTD